VLNKLWAEHQYAKVVSDAARFRQLGIRNAAVENTWAVSIHAVGGSLADAESHSRNAVDLAPTTAGYTANLAVIVAFQSRFAEAHELFTAAQEMTASRTLDTYPRTRAKSAFHAWRAGAEVHPELLLNLCHQALKGEPEFGISDDEIQSMIGAVIAETSVTDETIERDGAR
jgi:Flp pilus assembly protein TadD